jgi:hypothetical protein
MDKLEQLSRINQHLAELQEQHRAKMAEGEWESVTEQSGCIRRLAVR